MMEIKRHLIKSKAEIAEDLNISPRTLARYLNEEFTIQMRSVGYRKNQRLLPAFQYLKLFELLEFGMNPQD